MVVSFFDSIVANLFKDGRTKDWAKRTRGCFRRRPLFVRYAKSKSTSILLAVGCVWTFVVYPARKFVFSEMLPISGKTLAPGSGKMETHRKGSWKQSILDGIKFASVRFISFCFRFIRNRT